MSEETTNDGSWSGLKKTLIGTITTAITGGGVWLSTMLFGGHSEEKAEDVKGETKTETAVPAPVVVNVTQSQENKQKNENGGGTVIHERVIEKQAPAAAPAPAPKKEEDSW